MKSVNIVTSNEMIQTVTVSGSGALETTLTAAAVVDNGDGTVRLGVAADVFDAGSMIYIEGTDNYDGIRTIRSVTAGYINIEANYIAETTTTADTVKVAIAPDHSFEFLEIDIHISAVPTTSEDLTITKDAGAGANYDTNLLTEDFSTILTSPSISYIWSPNERKIYPNADDILRVAWDNSETRDFGLTLTYRKI